MPKVTYIARDGARTTLEVAEGNTVMLAAVFENLPGIEGACGGYLSCATCHVYVDEAFLPLLAPPSDDELSMLGQVAAPRRPNSRLGCQITMREALDGLVVGLPERQA